MIMLNESYWMFGWRGLAVMMLGIFLVQPRPGRAMTAILETEDRHA